MTTPVDQIETVLIPAGAFTMGDGGGRADERPAHRVSDMTPPAVSNRGRPPPCAVNVPLTLTVVTERGSDR